MVAKMINTTLIVKLNHEFNSSQQLQIQIATQMNPAAEANKRALDMQMLGSEEKKRRYNTRQDMYWHAARLLEQHEKSASKDTIVEAAVLFLVVSAKRDLLKDEDIDGDKSHPDELRDMYRKLKTDVEEGMKETWRDAKRRQREEVVVE